MGIGGRELVVLLGVAAAVIAVLYVVVRAAVASGTRQALRDTGSPHEDHRD